MIMDERTIGSVMEDISSAERVTEDGGDGRRLFVTPRNAETGQSTLVGWGWGTTYLDSQLIVWL